MTASSPSFTATDNASAGPTVSGLRSPMIESSIFLPRPFTAERPVMMSHDRMDVPSASPFRLRVVNAIALAGSAVRIEISGVDACRAACIAARNSSVFRIISILLVLLDWQAGGPHHAEEGFWRVQKGGYAVGFHGEERRRGAQTASKRFLQLRNWHCIARYAMREEQALRPTAEFSRS